MKTALITGITGQDGSYLADFLLQKGYVVHGIKRRASSFNTGRVDHIYQDPHTENQRFILHYGDLSDSSNLTRIIQEVQPDEVYNLGAQSHVAVSFEAPEYTADVDALGTLRLLEAIRLLGLEKKTRFYQASTSELYGLVQEIPQKETTPFYPRSPYAVAKLYSYWQWHSLQPRIAAAGRDVRDAQNHARPLKYRGGLGAGAVPGQSLGTARLGPREGLRPHAMADAAAGEARGFCDRDRRAVFGP